MHKESGHGTAGGVVPVIFTTSKAWHAMKPEDRNRLYLVIKVDQNV